jgi:hypothetical protein
MGQNLKVVWAEFSALRFYVCHCIAYTSMPKPRVENPAQVSFCELKFVHD